MTTTPPSPTPAGSSKKYRTICADPPWEIQDFPRWFGHEEAGTYETPYPMMTLDAIKALPVADLAEADRWHVNGDRGGCNLFLWTTTQYLVAAHDVARAWKFTPTAVLVWCKPHRPGGLGGTFKANVEFVVVARRGSPPRATDASPTRWFEWPSRAHSEKPEAFLDLVERVSPGPYLELFARRARFGWDYAGNESLGTVEIEGVAS